MTMAMPVPGWDNGGYQELVELLRRQVADRLATEGAQELSPAEREQRVARLVDEALDAYTRQRLTARQLPLDPPVEVQVAQAVRDALTGLGPLTPLLADPSITNILITGSTVFVTRTDGSKDRLPPIVTSSQALIDLIRDIAARVGTDERRFDRGVPRVSIRLPDGSRLFATMAVSRHPSVSIRRFTLLNASLDDLCLKYHAMDPGLRGNAGPRTQRGRPGRRRPGRAGALGAADVPGPGHPRRSPRRRGRALVELHVAGQRRLPGHHSHVELEAGVRQADDLRRPVRRAAVVRGHRDAGG